MTDFVHLHVHTEYSLLDGAVRLNKLFSRAFELGQKAVAITDHGNMFGALEFVKAAVRFTDPDADPFRFLAEGREFKVKPIIGCEVYLCPDRFVRSSEGGRMPKFNHLVLLAKNEIGYKNLVKIVSLSYTEGLYYKPRVDFSLLEKYSEGLIAMSACIAGEIPQAILDGDLERADRAVKKYVALYKDDFYIEIQDHNIKEQKHVLPHLIRLANSNGVPLVATNDAHYLEKKDSTMQRVLQCISFRNTLPVTDTTFSDDIADETVSEDGYFPTNEFYLKSGDEMAQLFPNFPEALSNTLKIADKCACNFFRKEPLLPEFSTPDGSKTYDFFRKLIYDGLHKKYGELTDEITERAEYELGIISRLGFVDYYLIVWDFIHFAEQNGISVGPGRGSGVGSIIAYAIGITKVDPLKYSLIFERFLNPERVSAPDFDIDFCVDRRDEVIAYVTEKYGSDNVLQIITFGTLAAKAAVKDVGRVYSHPYSEVDKITKLIPAMMGKNHIGHLLGILKTKDGSDVSVPELKMMYAEDDMARRILDMAMQIEGMPRQTGIHAAGVIICRDAISDHVPTAKSGEGIVSTQFNMIECEELGLLKMDFLGLRTLTDISKAVKYVKEQKGIDIDFYTDCEYSDPEVFKLIGSGDTHAVFQLESPGMKRFMRDLRPSSLEDIIAGISLYRPGPMDNIGIYVKNKKNPEGVVYAHEKLRPILDVTYGIMVYQEQVMQIVRELGGYSLGRADMVRRIMSKKKPDQMEKERQVFLYGKVEDGVTVEGAIARGVPEAAANKIYDEMSSFASYAFNKSHAAAYAYLAYQTAYLKAYHTVEFITAVLNNRITSIEEITNYLSYLKERGIEVLPPNINKSVSEFSVEKGSVRIGMAAIKNVGMGVIDDIVIEREKNGEFKSFDDFAARMAGRGINKKMMENLIYAGTFDTFGHTRATLIAVYERVLDKAAADKKRREDGQLSFFDMPGFDEQPIAYLKIREYSHDVKLKKEKEVAGVYLTGHPLELYSEKLKGYEINSSMFKTATDEAAADADMDSAAETGLFENMTVVLGGMLTEADRRFTKQNKEMGIAKIEDLYGTVEILASGFKYEKFKHLWQNDKLVTVKGKLKERDGSFNVWVDEITEWKKESAEKKRMICVVFSFTAEKDLSDKIQDVMLSYPGQDKAYAKNTDDGKNYPLPMTVDLSAMLIAELYGILPQERVIIVE